MTIPTEQEAMRAFEDLRQQACGEEIGKDSDSPLEAAQREGWEVLREWSNHRVLAMDGRGNLWVVADIYGPWAIQIKQSEHDAKNFPLHLNLNDQPEIEEGESFIEMERRTR